MNKFTYISDILKDKQFKIFLDDAIDEETHRRNCGVIVATKRGRDLKRNTFYQIESRGLFTVEGLSNEFELIEAGKSKLSGHERFFIHIMVDEQIRKTIEYYNVAPIMRFWKQIINKFKNYV